MLGRRNTTNGDRGQVVDKQRLTLCESKPRQRGVQESDTEALTKGICKIVTTLDPKKLIDDQLNELWEKALNGRPGPVMLEMPVDTSYKKVSDDKLKESEKENHFRLENKYLNSDFSDLTEALKAAQKPVVLIGNGARSVNNKLMEEFIRHLEETNIIYLSTWGAKDLIERFENLKYYLGSPGIFGNRLANAAIAKTDCLIVLGSSLSYTHTGYRVKNLNVENFHIVDIDNTQLNKPEVVNAKNTTDAAKRQ